MKRSFYFSFFIIHLSFLLFCGGISAQTIRVSTSKTDLVLRVGGDGRLHQSYLGARLGGDADIAHLSVGPEAYITHGMEDYFEPALEIRQPDGRSSILLKYVEHSVNILSEGVKETVITLADEVYPVTVRLRFTAYERDNIIRASTEISNTGRGRKAPTMTLCRYASSMLHFAGGDYRLTEFSGDWAEEAKMTTAPLTFGKKVLDTKLGTRANMFTPPMFIVSFDGQADEHTGTALLGTLGWTGNFRFTFEVTQTGELRVISGINPYYSERALRPGDTFVTPDFIFTLSTTGLGDASRDIHRWARDYQLYQGHEERYTLLNNWEATYFSFDEERLIQLMDNAADMGVDLFLLDDGWFGNKYPRSSDRQGLGDWEETREKLPGGVARLTQAAGEKGIRFGIWVEPEMVNPKSELYEKHPDWVIHQPDVRDEYYFRNQLVLDLSNPAVQDYVFSVIDRLMTDYPDIAFMKWDCNSPITNIWSPYLKEKQTQLYVDYVHGLYSVLERINAKYPALRMMLCSGGSGRIDYKALSYFTEFWASDNTNPIDRLFIQYGYSFFYPSRAVCAHVTSWNRNASIKFRTDVASMGKLGFDIRFNELDERDQEYIRQAVKNWKRLSYVIADGDQYRLYSPYDGPHAATQFVSPRDGKSVLFAFDVHPMAYDRTRPLRFEGLDPDADYRVEEINLVPGTRSSLRANGQTFSGRYLMTVGLDVFTSGNLRSRVVEITKQ
ncbi:MAG: alpha-galactosidase [Bacteroidaceae bacterium]|nr:alpha-galactosidase [Bacteroidaceae bacterium]